jgi:hypothetical protein
MGANKSLSATFESAGFSPPSTAVSRSSQRKRRWLETPPCTDAIQNHFHLPLETMKRIFLTGGILLQLSDPQTFNADLIICESDDTNHIAHLQVNALHHLFGQPNVDFVNIQSLNYDI